MGCVDVTVSMLKSIQQDLTRLEVICFPWGELDLSHFVAAVFRHSKVSYSVLLTALLYILRFRHAFSNNPLDVMNISKCLPSSNTVLVVFVSALVLSSKFLHDRHTSNLAWASHTGISSAEINRGEIFFLNVIQHQLSVDQTAFHKWMTILFQPGNLVPYQIFPQDCQKVPQMMMKAPTGLWTNLDPQESSFNHDAHHHPNIDFYRRRPEQTFMGYYPAG